MVRTPFFGVPLWGRHRLLLGALLAGVLAISLFMSYGERMREEIMMAFAPSAERAFEYGTAHFDAKHADDYDLARAEALFSAAESIDPDYPYLNHQMARIAFLKGNFHTALTYIDREIQLHGSTNSNAHYVRGLIKGFMGDYEGAAQDYETYLRTDPKNWAAINDYAWVLLKDRRYKEALIALDWGLIYWPENPWLHNSRATALFELGRLEDARDAAEAASRAVADLSEADWLQAYPGNDPLIAPSGIAAFKKAVGENMHTISLALKNAQKDMQ